MIQYICDHCGEVITGTVHTIQYDECFYECAEGSDEGDLIGIDCNLCDDCYKYRRQAHIAYDKWFYNIDSEALTAFLSKCPDIKRVIIEEFADRVRALCNANACTNCPLDCSGNCKGNTAGRYFSVDSSLTAIKEFEMKTKSKEVDRLL